MVENRIRELKEFVEQECTFGYSWGVETEDGVVRAWWSKYLDDGYGCYTTVSVYYEVSAEGEVLRVDGFTLEELEKEERELLKQCPNGGNCEECDGEGCEVGADLAYLQLVRDYLEYLENNLPTPEVEGVEEALEHAGR